MNLSRLFYYVLLISIINCGGVFICQQTVSAQVPMQIRVNINPVTDNQRTKQVQLLQQLQLLFTTNQVQAGFWFSGAAYQQIKSFEPTLVKNLFDDGLLIAHHGANRGKKGKSPIEQIRGMNWDSAVAWVSAYENTPDKGGLRLLQQDFKGKIQVTGRFFQAPVLQAVKELGCTAMIGLKDQLNAPSNAAWYMGMFNLPDRVTITPKAIRKAVHQTNVLRERIKTAVKSSPSQSMETISLVVHNYDFFKGSLEEQQKFFTTYQDIISWISTQPALETVTYQELIARIIDDRHPLLNSRTLFNGAQSLLYRDSLPLYLTMNASHFSLTDMFYSLSSALTTYHGTAKLPTRIQAENLLGPVVAGKASQPVSVTGTSIISAASSWLGKRSDRVPAVIALDGSSVNGAQFLFAMAEVYSSLYQGHGIRSSIQLKPISIFPEQTSSCPDELSRLQFWTYKPQRARIRQSITQPIDKKQPTRAKNNLQPNITPVYVTLYSHNEDGDPWKRLLVDPSLYIRYRFNLIKKIRLIQQHGAALSWQTDHTVLQAMLKYEKGELLQSTNNKNIVRWMKEDMGVEITPHGHLTTYNYADIARLIHELGVTPAPVIGGFALYNCNKNNRTRPLLERPWRKELSIDSNGTISGRIYPTWIWKPEILVQPAMIGHLFDEFSSGVWRAGSPGSFTEHDSNGGFIVIGQGYPHYRENIGSRHAGGVEVKSSSLGYIKELVQTINTRPEMRGRIYTASIHLRDYPDQQTVNTLDGLKDTLQEITHLVTAGQVIFMNYANIATLWQDSYQGKSNRFSIDRTSLFPSLEQDLLQQCLNAEQKKQHSPVNRGKCGDGLCDNHEQRSGRCPSDCTDQQPANNTQSDAIKHNLCGDTVCDEHEKRSGMCQQDCR